MALLSVHMRRDGAEVTARVTIWRVTPDRSDGYAEIAQIRFEAPREGAPASETLRGLGYALVARYGRPDDLDRLT